MYSEDTPEPKHAQAYGCGRPNLASPSDALRTAQHEPGHPVALLAVGAGEPAQIRVSTSFG